MSTLGNRITRLVAVTMAVVMVMALTGCDKSPSDETTSGDQTVDYSVIVQNKAGTALGKCSVEVYSDAEKTNQIYKGITNSDGTVSFSAPESDGYVAVVSKQPTGYAVEESYELAGEKTTIVLAPGVMTDADMDTVEYSLGDAMMDFSVTTPDGEKIVLSELLQQKKAVVLNFWYLNCNPCKMEFPHMQQGYEQLGNDIALLALNPYDGTDAEVADFRMNNGYTFTMAKCDSRWGKIMKIQSYPTTVVIDRYGNICLIHNGMITETQTFLNMVNYFISDDYEQAFFRSVGQIPTNAT